MLCAYFFKKSHVLFAFWFSCYYDSTVNNVVNQNLLGWGVLIEMLCVALLHSGCVGREVLHLIADEIKSEKWLDMFLTKMSDKTAKP